MGDLRARRLNELADRVTGHAGALPRGVRRQLVSGGGIAGELRELAELVSAGGSGVTDGHVRRLLAAGHTADELFECIVTAAVGAGLERLRAVERLLRDRPP
ncbi:MAG TPA: carboxymuconolactone decarboxylase family protein [Pseudonocardiaceae bacterium]|nr:carboxymuconolactone decarboxylase family protein [Pseudonocardiaceae bacterium]